MYLKAGTTITLRKDERRFLEPSNFREMEWFRPPGYKHTSDDCYGSFQGTYILDRVAVLLNLGNRKDRKLVLDYTDLTPNDFDPDEQYCGHDANMKVHKAILSSPNFRNYDGTIISKQTTDTDLLGELEGPEEVVLFTDRTRYGITLIQAERI